MPKPVLIIVLVFTGIFLFYWFQIRPSDIKSSCTSEANTHSVEVLKTKAAMSPKSESLQKAAEQNMYSKDDYDYYYKLCLQKKGL